jgi:hypothetical protein
MQDQKCPIHGRKLVRKPRSAPSFSWATGYSSLENLAPIQPVILICPEAGCDSRDEVQEEPLFNPSFGIAASPSCGPDG